MVYGAAAVAGVVARARLHLAAQTIFHQKLARVVGRQRHAAREPAMNIPVT